MATGITVGGKLYPVLHPITGHPIPIFSPEDTGIQFEPGDGYNKKRVKDIDLGVFHWTGSENAVETMARVLRKRKLGVEFAISPYGSIYQFCDPLEVDTADAGIANSRSWGVEIVNAGIRRWKTMWREPRYRKVPMGPRKPFEMQLHGRKRKIRCWDFYTVQTISACALNRVLVEAIETYPSEVCTTPGVVTIKGENPVKGAIGHYNVTKKKLDPGTKLMETLSEFMQYEAKGSFDFYNR
jgi:hypothetical protein